MADISKLSRLLNGVQRQVDLSANTIVVDNIKMKLGGSFSASFSGSLTADRLISMPDAAVDLSQIATNAQGISDHLADAVDAHDASAISSVPAGNLAATDVQAALNELDSEKAASADLASTSNALGASLIGIEDAATQFTSTNVEGALTEALDAAQAAQATADNHIADATDAHDASAISSVPAGNLAATDVQAALNELDSEKAASADLASTSNALGASLIGIEDAATQFTSTNVEGALTEALDAAQAAQSTADGKVSKAGDSMNSAANLTFSGGGEVLGLPSTPSVAGAAASKAYVDSVAAGLDPKASVRVATTAVLSGTMTADNVAPTTGNRSYDTTAKTISWFATEGPASIDGVALSDGDRILVKNETSTSGPSAGEGRIYNGIYVRTSADVWTRATDQDGSPANEVSGGNFTFVEQGSTNINAGFVLQGNGILTLQTDNIVWVQFSGAGSITNGNGLDKSGNVLSVKADVVETSTVLASAINVDANGVSVKVDDSTIEGSGQGVAGAESLRVKDSGISTAKLAATSVTAAKLGADVAGSGLTGGNGSAVAVDFSTTFAEANKAIAAAKLASNANGEGASIIGIEDTAAQFTSTNVEGALAEAIDAAQAAQATADNHIADAVDAHDASAISNVPAGNIAATDVQAAINELDSEKASSADLASTANALGASLIGIEDAAGKITATTVEGALAELAAATLDTESLSEVMTAGEEFLNTTTGWAVRVGVSTLDTPETANRIYKADPTEASLVKTGGNVDAFNVVGLMDNAATVSIAGTGTVVKSGRMTITGHGMTGFGEPFYLASGGTLTQTAPSTAGEAVVKLGMVRDANTVEVAIQIMGVN